MTINLILLAFALQAGPTARCTAITPPPADLEAWSTVGAKTTGPIAIGKATGLRLQPIAKVDFSLPPGREAKPGTFGGVYAVDVATPGTYRIALQGAAWIDVVRGGTSIASTAHTEGPPCSTIRKIVDFPLAAGRYTIQLSGAQAEQMRVLIVRH